MVGWGVPELMAPMTTMAMATPLTRSMKRTYMVHLDWSVHDDILPILQIILTYRIWPSFLTDLDPNS